MVSKDFHAEKSTGFRCGLSGAWQVFRFDTGYPRSCDVNSELFVPPPQLKAVHDIEAKSQGLALRPKP